MSELLKISAVGAFLSIAGALSASAQMSVTTIGATNAQACYRDANDAISTDTSYCDQALQGEALSRRDINATLVNRGIILNRAGKLDAALADFDRALQRDPDLAEAYLNRGNTYFLMRQLETAIDDYKLSLAKGIDEAHVAWYNIGLANDALKRPELAREAYERSVRAKPDFELANRKLARDTNE